MRTTTPTMPFEFGDVVLVPFPFTNQAARKQRPAIVISNATYNGARPDVILMAVTSRMRADPIPGDAVLQDWQVAGLIKPSLAKPVFATFEQGIVIRRLGTLAAGDRAAVRDALAASIG